MMPSSNPLVMLIDIFRAPSSAFVTLHKHAVWGWQPYLFLILSPFLFWGSYFDLVNFDWLYAELSVQLAETNPAQLELLDANTLMASEIISDILGRTTTIFILALWFNLATKSSRQPQGFWRWFAASSVIMFPAVIGDFASYASVLLKHGQVMTYAADLNSLNGLLKLPLTHDWSQFASTVPLLLPWYIVLGYAAVLTWTEFERGQAIVVSALPWVGYLVILALYTAIS
ncbi:YIP1 family protein [Vibrio amylolyticus]|uniref:YIP1 family protein n=1 Tax=Vibrio amylolyticus TaxID=2847292 RepID=UPI003550DC3C